MKKKKEMSLYEQTIAAKPMFKSYREAIAFYRGLSNRLQKEFDFALRHYEDTVCKPCQVRMRVKRDKK